MKMDVFLFFKFVFIKVLKFNNNFKKLINVKLSNLTSSLHIFI